MAGEKWGDKIMSERHPAARLAVDIGGTVTDIVLLAPERRFRAPVLTTPQTPQAAVRAVAARLQDLDIEAVAVALIHAYANPSHELRIGEILAEICPKLSVTLSSQACPEAREYERTCTAIANAYVQPLMSGYLRRL